MVIAKKTTKTLSLGADQVFFLDFLMGLLGYSNRSSLIVDAVSFKLKYDKKIVKRIEEAKILWQQKNKQI
ncbi:MAG: hypothetical protein ACTSQ8_08125 [Candidatus Helarchaeota archaeon]